MAITFPSTPSEDQVFNVSPGKSFVFKGGVWRKAPMTTAMPKNYLINPCMQVSQQNGTTEYAQGNLGVGGTSAVWWPADQWSTQWAYGDLTGIGGTFYTKNDGLGSIEFKNKPFAPN